MHGSCSTRSTHRGPTALDAHARRPILPIRAQLHSKLASTAKRPTLRSRPQLNNHSYSLFTRQIRGCSDWNELRILYLKQRDQLNTINLLALVHQLAKVSDKKSLAKYEDLGRQAFITHVVDDLSQSRHADKLELRGLANVLWGLARLGHNPGATWMDHMLLRMLQQLQAAGGCEDPLSLSQAMWAVAKLGHAPPPAWLDAFFPMVTSSMPGLSPQALANVLWGMAVLQAPPRGASFWPAYYEASMSHMHSFSPQAVALALPSFQPLDISHVLWGSARLRLEVPQKLLKALLVHCRSKMRDFGTQEIANTLWALTTLRARPKQVWLLAVCERAKRCMTEFKPQELATLVWAMANLAGEGDDKASLARMAPAFFFASLPALQFFNAQVGNG
ncbi:hypothetical protein DUNSADRAFT_17997 [Dunaliella salina]|uniref:Tbc2 translation factor, chloroplastic n=1 Tax=Dunaliella salina TaxID=3046 RepID=A0ABQ7G0W2_DUNSA|nr:hypothetical protein DUNSADRAFT_17997 [Dunaliella salina]|eukprot:KAF5828230.1 hypothetical protein DUNSADRAFT_17997 [Dunaliella salina]